MGYGVVSQQHILSELLDVLQLKLQRIGHFRHPVSFDGAFGLCSAKQFWGDEYF